MDGKNMNVNEVIDQTVTMNDMKEIDAEIVYDTPNDAYTDIENEYGSCKSVKETIQCEKCTKHFCTECQLKVHGESILNFFKIRNF